MLTPNYETKINSSAGFALLEFITVINWLNGAFKENLATEDIKSTKTWFHVSTSKKAEGTTIQNLVSLLQKYLIIKNEENNSECIQSNNDKLSATSSLEENYNEMLSMKSLGGQANFAICAYILAVENTNCLSRHVIEHWYNV